MNIQSKNNNAHSINFWGIHIAETVNRAKDITTTINLYKVTDKDKVFLENLRKSVKMENLMPNSNITPLQFKCWQDMLDYAVEMSHLSSKKSVIASVGQKPCGIMTFTPSRKAYELDCICTWPVEYGKKVCLAGQTLFKHLFSTFLDSNADKINLTALTNGPFSPVSFYQRLGFGQNGGGNFFVNMSASRAKVFNKMLELNDLIKTNKTQDMKDIDLSKILEL